MGGCHREWKVRETMAERIEGERERERRIAVSRRKEKRLSLEKINADINIEINVIKES